MTFRAFAWGARGYVLSDDDDAGALAMSDIVGDVFRVLDHFNCDKAHIVGLSMGGLIGMCRNPDLGQNG